MFENKHRKKEERVEEQKKKEWSVNARGRQVQSKLEQTESRRHALRPRLISHYTLFAQRAER